jgi:signal transduction histidine kinase
MSALSTMAGAVAHHFNNLLGGVLTSIDFALATDDPAVLRRALRTTVSALSRANDLTVNLLSFAEGDRSPSSPEDAARTVNHFVESVAPRLAESQVKLETDVLAVTPIVPAKQLLTILDCLETNATEAMPDGGTLRIELLPGPGHSLVLRVSDTGPGIPRDQLPYVFEPFFTTKRGGPPNDTMHAGLGLAVVHGLVKDLGGVVTVGPAEGGGTICTVCLPGEGIRDPL